MPLQLSFAYFRAEVHWRRTIEKKATGGIGNVAHTVRSQRSFKIWWNQFLQARALRCSHAAHAKAGRCGVMRYNALREPHADNETTETLK